jgi:voltage-gated sodium channel
MIAQCRMVAESRRFQSFIMAVIVANAVVLGLETSETMRERHGESLMVLNWLFQTIFVAEITIRLTACWPRWTKFFTNGWNVFDFVVVAASLLPINGASVTVGRLLRLLRVTRLVSISPGLRLIVATMLTSIPSMGHVVLMLSLLIYIYAVLGYQSFHHIDPAHWGSLAASALSLFQVITLEGWADLQQAVLPRQPFAWLFFASFIVVAVFVVMNLFIAVVINNLESAKDEERRREDAQNPEIALLNQLQNLRKDLLRLERDLRMSNAGRAVSDPADE